MLLVGCVANTHSEDSQQKYIRQKLQWFLWGVIVSENLRLSLARLVMFLETDLH